MNVRVLLILSLLSGLPVQSLAQDSFMYGVLGADFSKTYKGGSLHLNVINDRLVIQIGGLGSFKEAASTPVDFVAPESDIPLVGGGPIDAHLMAHVSAGVSLGFGDFFRLNLMAGVGNSWYHEPTNWELTGQPDEADNYDFDYGTKSVVGLILHPGLEFTLSKPMGIAVSPLVIINERGTQTFLEVSFLLGNVRNN